MLLELAERGYAVVDESARAVIRERLSNGLTPRPEPEIFAREILGRDLEKYSRTSKPDTIFFDRSALEAIGMLHDATGLDNEELEILISSHSYFHRVFILPPWEAIYRTDSERDQTFEDALRIHASILNWYRRWKYETIEVPVGPVSERCSFVLTQLAGSDA